MPAEKKVRSHLLEEAAKAIAPLIGGCAGAIAGPAGAAVGAAVGAALESKICRAVSYAAEKAFEYFAPGIVERWLNWLRGKPRAEQLGVIAELGTLPAEEARREAAAAVEQVAPEASPADKALAQEYLAAIPATVRRSLVRDQHTGAWTVLNAISPDSRQSLLQLLPSTLPPYQAGTQLPGTPYRLEELLGTGGFGAVYKATATTLQYLTFAIKFCLDPGMTDALIRERKNLDRLLTAGKGDWSERVVRLYGYDLDHATPFLVYEYVAGGDLALAIAARWRAKGRGFAPEQALKVVHQIAQALAFVHQRGLVHRDLKPANVLLSGRTLKLADFGIGGVVADKARVGNRIGTTALNQLSMAEQASLYRGAGTPLYMSPEQRRGEPADPRQDLFSLGVLWYQLLVGDVTRELHPGWDDELLGEDIKAPREHIDLIKRCVGLVKLRPKDAGELVPLLNLPLPNIKSHNASEPIKPAPQPFAVPVAEPVDSIPDAVPATPAPPALRSTPQFAPYRKEVLLNQLKQLQRCHKNVAKAKVSSVAAIMVYLGGALLSSGLGCGCLSGFGRFSPVESMILVFLPIPFVAVGILHLLIMRIDQNRRGRAKRRVIAKIDEIVAEFPEEVRSWGGSTTLATPHLIPGLIQLVEQGS